MKRVLRKFPNFDSINAHARASSGLKSLSTVKKCLVESKFSVEIIGTWTLLLLWEALKVKCLNVIGWSKIFLLLDFINKLRRFSRGIFKHSFIIGFTQIHMIRFDNCRQKHDCKSGSDILENSVIIQPYQSKWGSLLNYMFFFQSIETSSRCFFCF